MPINFQYFKTIIPGVLLALVFCLFSQGINNLLAIEIFGTLKSPISTVLIAILLGLLMGNAFTPRPVHVGRFWGLLGRDTFLVSDLGRETGFGLLSPS